VFHFIVVNASPWLLEINIIHSMNPGSLSTYHTIFFVTIVFYPDEYWCMILQATMVCRDVDRRTRC
jgi:hypothetical protein